jgi:tetratricopeptide (TPR) repeat protein
MNKMPESRKVIERALQLDPYSPFAHGSYGLYLLLAHRFDDAITQFRKMLKEKLDFGLAHAGMWTAYHHQGKFQEAFAETKAAFEDVPAITELLDDAYKQDGYPGAMRQLADVLAVQEVTYILPTNIARLYAYAGDKEEALKFLGKAYDDKDSGLVHLKVDPDWDTLRNDPRFLKILKEMDFPN